MEAEPNVVPRDPVTSVVDKAAVEYAAGVGKLGREAGAATEPGVPAGDAGALFDHRDDEFVHGDKPCQGLADDGDGEDWGVDEVSD